MSCIINLLSDILPNADTGGAWEYLGMSNTSTNAPTGTTTSLTGDNPSIDTATYPPGYLFFSYTGIDNCGASQTITVNFYNAAPPNAGQNGTTTHCSNETQILNLFSYLSGAPQTNLTWTSTGATPPAGSFDSANGTFDLSLINVAATYTFEASAASTVSNSYPLHANCTCLPDTSIVTVTINQGADAGNATQQTICNTDSANLNTIHNSSNNLTGLSYSFFGYRAGTSGVYSSGIFSINGASAQTHSPNTSIPSPTDLSNFGANGQYLFLVNAGTAPCNDSSTILIIVETCSSPCAVSAAASYNAAADQLVASQTGCSTPTYQWQILSSTWTNISGANSNILASPANGTYRVIVTCADGAGCSDTSNQVVINNTDPCNVSVQISNTNEVFTSTVTGCTSSINYAWQYRAGTTGAWTTISNGAGLTATQTGYYRLIVTCGSCSALSGTSFYQQQDPCAFGVSISETSGQLTANLTGCSGSATFAWQYSASGTGWTSTGQSTQTITPNNGDGFYQVIVNCTENGQTCPNSTTYNYTAPPCSVSASASYSQSSDVIIGQQTGCNAATWQWQKKPTGVSTWSNVTGETAALYFDPPGKASYRVIVTCADGAGCSDTSNAVCIFC